MQYHNFSGKAVLVLVFMLILFDQAFAVNENDQGFGSFDSLNKDLLQQTDKDVRSETIEKTIFVHHGTLLAKKADNNPTEFFVTDHLGSARQVLEGDQPVQEDDYYAFGESKANSFSEENKFRFSGKELDDTGLYFYGARYYNPVVGRFNAADALIGNMEDPQSLNRYAYVSNNPLKYVDPTGNDKAKSDSLLTESARRMARKIFPDSTLNKNSQYHNVNTVGDYLQSIQVERTELPVGKAAQFHRVKRTFFTAAGDTVYGASGLSMKLDSTLTDSDTQKGFGSIAHELTHGVQDALGMGESDFVQIYNDFAAGASPEEKGFLQRLCNEYIGADSAQTDSNKAIVGEEIMPTVSGMIARGAYVTDRVKNQFSLLSDRFKDNTYSRKKTENSWIKSYVNSLKESKK